MRPTTELAPCVLLAGLTCLACTSSDAQPNVLPDGDSTTGSNGGDAELDATSQTEAIGSSTGEPEIEGQIPCEVGALLAENCRSCHGDPPRFGAPMPLVHLADVLAPLPSNPVVTVADAMRGRIRDSVRPMPPTGLLADDDREVLAAWLEGGAQPGEDPDCEVVEPDPGPAVGPEALPCEPSHEFRAHGADPSAPFHVPDVDDVYTCFNFPSPFAAQAQALAWAPIIDDDRVLHHFILYATSVPLEVGGVGPCQIPEDATYLAGWAPGRENVELPEHVGLELPDPGGTMILEIHYNNVASHADALDRSGIAFCTSDEPRQDAAGFIRLGTYDIDIPAGAEGHEEIGMCPTWETREIPGPLNVISTFPHMHELGRGFRTELLRGGDEEAVEFLVDVPHFSFDYQVGYDLDPFVQLLPGDALRTTCTYDNPADVDVGYGPGTSDEMCFNRLLVYPVDQMPWRECVY